MSPLALCPVCSGKYLTRIVSTALTTILNFSLIHLMFLYGNPWVFRNIFKWCVHILIYISHSQLLNIIILKLNSPVLLNQLGNIFPYKSSWQSGTT